ncbi:class I SAM-dependent methyltransferase [Treponema zuelzerae]|uniref:Class I SAM-dependent methyltransferase n=1 Tax=Teretinema zuelzerae TaxID=156 RepID=A0AAE3EHL8_9SPIR|nr:class I SAM-dependent methyltransferase [Teretinema zuelzerae]MBN2811189.1 methyltransferase domain-containing protein [Spirochaetales bacterium]MCD1654375.1 class I SAM-dependent methyltransferase [Teretinema zuelzerae]
MIHSSSQSRDNSQVIETLQDFYTAILEYYDELFPMNTQALDCISRIQLIHKADKGGSSAPMFRYLGVGCATGNLENRLSGPGLDITGIDKNSAMIETAKRRIKKGFSSIRFFEMSAMDMGRFLKKESFHLIGCLENTLPYIGDEILVRKFFHDARELLAPEGLLLLQTVNFDSFDSSKPFVLPQKQSVRVQLDRSYIPTNDGCVTLKAELEQGNGRRLILQQDTKLRPAPTEKIFHWANEAGFSECAFFADFNQSPWSADCPETIIVCRK